MTSKRGQLDGLGLRWRNSIRVADATRNLEDPDPWGSGLAGSWQQHLREGGLEFDQVTGSSLSLPPLSLRFWVLLGRQSQ